MNIPTLTLFFHLAVAASVSIEICLDSVCQTKEPAIRFPFHIEKKQSDTCGFPGFSVFCNSKGQTLLNLPNWGDLKIQGINYASQQLWLNDPNDCLAQRLLSLNLSASPFNAVYYQQFTYFNCSSNLEYLAVRYNRIACMSDSSSEYAVFATPSPTVVTHLSSLCELVRTVKVPVQSPFYGQVLSSDLSGDLRLSWNSPACGRCESHGGRCGFKSNSSFELECSSVPSKGIFADVCYVIAICAGIPAMFCFIGILSCIYNRFRNSSHSWAWAHEMVPDFEVLAGSQPTIIMGLDGPTIESYPKIVIGRSIRLPKPDDKTCSICLSEYMPEEIVKTIPQCGHWFHAQCIDEWLPLNASCPICRTSPRKLPQPRAQS